MQKTSQNLTWRAWMSKITRLVGPPLEMGIFESIRARVKAVAMSPSSSMRSNVPVGKNGNTRVKDETNIRGKAYMIDSCSKITVGELNDAKKATCWPRMPCALGTNTFGNPSANVLLHGISETHHQKMAARNSQVEHETSPFDVTVE